MRITLLIVSVILIFMTVALAVFIEPKSGNVSGGGWTIPFWPFVLLIAFALNPFVHDLFRVYMKTKVEIAKAENGIEEKKPTTPPPAYPPEPTEIAKGG